MPRSTEVVSTEGTFTLELGKNQKKALLDILNDHLDGADQPDNAAGHFKRGHLLKIVEKLEGSEN